MKIKKIILALSLVVTLNVAFSFFISGNGQATNSAVAIGSDSAIQNVVGPMDPPPQ